MLLIKLYGSNERSQKQKETFATVDELTKVSFSFSIQFHSFGYRLHFMTSKHRTPVSHVTSYQIHTFLFLSSICNHFMSHMSSSSSNIKNSVKIATISPLTQLPFLLLMLLLLTVLFFAMCNSKMIWFKCAMKLNKYHMQKSTTMANTILKRKQHQ